MRRKEETWGHSYQIEKDKDFISLRDLDHCLKQIGVAPTYKIDNDDVNWDIIVIYVTPHTKVVYKKERYLKASQLSK